MRARARTHTHFVCNILRFLGILLVNIQIHLFHYIYCFESDTRTFCFLALIHLLFTRAPWDA